MPLYLADNVTVERLPAAAVAPAQPPVSDDSAPPPPTTSPAAAAPGPATALTARDSIDGPDGTPYGPEGTVSQPAPLWQLDRCHPDNPLASSHSECRTPRDGTLASFWIGLDFGVAALHDDVEARIQGGPGASGQVRLGVALWDQLAIGLAFSGLVLKDEAGYTTLAFECAEVDGAIIDCDDEPVEVGSTLDAVTGALEVGYQYRFRPWAAVSIVPGVMAGYLHAFGGLERSIACDGCGRVRLDVDLDGAYLAPFVRVTFGRTGPFALVFRPQYFLSGALRHATYVGFELGMP
jgi:hypothetical protein